MKLKDRTNKKYGRLTVVMLHKSIVSGGRKRVFWECQCECGALILAESGRLESGYTKSCGCLRQETTKNINMSHGESNKTKEYRAWSKMKSRCFCKTDAKYYAYGERGISVCDRWINSYPNFLKDMGRAPSKIHSLDRRNVNGNYEPGNCRWATPHQQMNNMRQTIIINRRGESMSMKEWCTKLQIPYKQAHALKQKKGYSFDQIINHYGKV